MHTRGNLNENEANACTFVIRGHKKRVKKNGKERKKAKIACYFLEKAVRKSKKGLKKQKEYDRIH